MRWAEPQCDGLRVGSAARRPTKPSAVHTRARSHKSSECSPLYYASADVRVTFVDTVNNAPKSDLITQSGDSLSVLFPGHPEHTVSIRRYWCRWHSACLYASLCVLCISPNLVGTSATA